MWTEEQTESAKANYRFDLPVAKRCENCANCYRFQNGSGACRTISVEMADIRRSWCECWEDPR